MRPAPPTRLRTTALAFLLASLGATAGLAEESVDYAPVAHDPTDAHLTGRDIYQRVLDNRFRSYIQESTMLSGDRGGNVQETRLQMWFQSFRDEAGKAANGIASKTLVKYLEPFDLRHTGYLIIQHPDKADQQFVYLPTQRRVKRVSLRGEAVFGTDLSFEDVIPREIEHADYERRPDTLVEDIPCFVVEAIPKEIADSEYSRFLVYVDKTRDVPLRTRYWDDAGIEIKELSAAVASIERVEDVWIPMLATMRHLRLETFTTVRIVQIVPNPERYPLADSIR